MKYSVTYLGEGPKDWLKDFWCKRLGDVYVVGADCDTKRADSIFTGSSSVLSSDGGVSGWSVDLSIVLKDLPFTVASIKFYDLEGYSVWDWEFRYGPTVVLVPVWKALDEGAEEELELVPDTEVVIQAGPNSPDGAF